MRVRGVVVACGGSHQLLSRRGEGDCACVVLVLVLNCVQLHGL